MRDQKSYLTNTFDNSKFTTFGNTIASNGRARVEQTDDGRLYVVIDGVKYSANKYDLFGMNDNPVQWLETFVSEYDKEAQKEKIGAVYDKQVRDIDAKMAENTQKAKESRTIQERIKKAILTASIKLSSFLKECGVNLRSSLSGDKKAYADNIYEHEYWGNRFALVSESNSESALLNSNCRLAANKNFSLKQAYGL